VPKAKDVQAQDAIDREEKARLICERIASGTPMSTACSEEGLKHSAFMNWVERYENIRDNYARAKSDGVEKMAADLLAISDEEAPRDAQGRTDSGFVAAQRLKVDTRKWLLSKVAPKKYGEKLEISGDAASPLHVHATIDVSGLSVAALEELANLRKK